MLKKTKEIQARRNRPLIAFDPSLIICSPESPGDRAHSVFLSLGLRHLVIVKENTHVAGMITRKDLDYAAGFGPWRRNKPVPKANAFGTGATSQFAHTIRAVCSSFTPHRNSPIENEGLVPISMSLVA